MSERDKLRDGDKTNFEQVSEFNKAIGRRVAGDLVSDTVDLQLDLIIEELYELQVAIQEGYLPNIRKELADLLVVTYGLGFILSFDCDADFKAVNDNNMSKLITSDRVKRETHAMYYSLGVDVDFMDVAPHTYVVMSAKDQVVDGKEYPKGKRLKPAGYKPLELT